MVFLSPGLPSVSGCSQIWHDSDDLVLSSRDGQTWQVSFCYLPPFPAGTASRLENVPAEPGVGSLIFPYASHEKNTRLCGHGQVAWSQRTTSLYFVARKVSEDHQCKDSQLQIVSLSILSPRGADSVNVQRKTPQSGFGQHP